MRIAIDAKWYFSGPVSTRTILQNLLPELFKIYPEHEWIIYLNKKDREKNFPFKKKNINIEYVWAKNNLLSNVFLLPSLNKKLKPDVIVFQTFTSIRKNVPYIVFIHDLLFHQFPSFFTWKERLYFLTMKWLTRRADRFISTTNFVARDLVKYNYVKNFDQIDIVPLGVNKSFKPANQLDSQLLQSVKKKYNLPDHFLLYVGRLNARKNIETLLKALPLLHDKNIKLVIAGNSDWKKPKIEGLMSSEMLRQRIIFTGHLKNDELTAIYSLAYIFCFPSFAEGFGLPPIEAMASGIPVIVSNTTALPEVCGDAATYIDPSRPESVAEAINNLSETKSLYAQKCKDGIAKAARFTWSNTAEKLMQSILKSVQKKKYEC